MVAAPCSAEDDSSAAAAAAPAVLMGPGVVGPDGRLSKHAVLQHSRMILDRWGCFSLLFWLGPRSVIQFQMTLHAEECTAAAVQDVTGQVIDIV